VTARQPLATPKEVAAHLGKAVQTLYNWHSKRIGPPAIKAGHDLRYRWADVDRWLDERTGRAA
jgi:predicted DNA-binding transcriptional regulator AlpA